jgi:hypothetical protein
MNELFMANYMKNKMNDELKRLIQQEEVLAIQKTNQIELLKKILLKPYVKRTNTET